MQLQGFALVSNNEPVGWLRRRWCHAVTATGARRWARRGWTEGGRGRLAWLRRWIVGRWAVATRWAWAWAGRRTRCWPWLRVNGRLRRLVHWCAVAWCRAIDRSRSDRRCHVSGSRAIDRSRSNRRRHVGRSRAIDRSRSNGRCHVGGRWPIDRSRSNRRSYVGRSRAIDWAGVAIGRRRHIGGSRAIDRAGVAVARRRDIRCTAVAGGSV